MKLLFCEGASPCTAVVSVPPPGVCTTPGRSDQEVLVIARFHRQIDDGLRAHGSADHRAGRVQHGDGLCHFHGLRDLAGSQLRIDSRILPQPHRDVLALESLESVRRGANGICAGIQVGRDIFAGLIGGQSSARRRSANL